VRKEKKVNNRIPETKWFENCRLLV
jgi:hypothetical protein